MKRIEAEFVSQDITVTTYFGDEAAEIEWDESPEDSANTFLHTESYKKAQEKNVLYLFGRRGTGKTSIVRMMDYEINNDLFRKSLEDAQYQSNAPFVQEPQPYKYSYVINQEDAYHELASQLRGSPISELPEDELVHFLTKKWSWVISISAMASVVRRHEATKSTDEYLKIISKYLVSQRITTPGELDNAIWRRATQIISQNLEKIDYTYSKLGAALSRIFLELLDPTFEEAQAALHNFLRKRKAISLVFVDSLEFYNFRDHIKGAVITSLIEVARRFLQTTQKNGICVKAAFPSELYPFLNVLNHEKMEGKVHFIVWSYRDLTCMLAKRHFAKFSSDKLDEYSMDALEEYDHAKKYLYQFLPESIETKQGLVVDTISYIIRHTQKKPRQVILLFNIIHTLAAQEKIDFYQIPADFIRQGVHARLDILIKGTIDIYDKIYKNGEAITKRVITNAPSIFNHNVLTSMIKETNSLRAEEKMSTDDVIKLLLQTGVIGIEYRKSKIRGKRITLIEGLYEYQVKGIINYDNKTRFVLHPMLYQDVNATLDNSQYIYPKPIEDAEEQALAVHGIVIKQ